ncbi:MAG: DNA double-strand break repair nuclease NurA [Candidatus Aenigmarchaeota archaeon]|nr:DNA double-strand break repair nuclease NurA [Candidatus Aenigmarchaeota archaeon]
MVKKIAGRIQETETKRLKLAEFVKQISPETNLKVAVTPDQLKNLKVAAVDGGILKKSLHGMDCMLVRAAGACFHYSDGKVVAVNYHPSQNPTPRPEVYESLSELDWLHFSSLARLKEEITTAIQCIETLQPNVLLLDGLILPHCLDRPPKTSPLYPTYKELLNSYTTLFKNSIEQNVALAGVVEDSRSCTFCNFLMESVLSRLKHEMVPELKSLLKKSRDSNLLYLILEKGERTCLFPIAPPLTMDADIPLMKTFYLKTAKYDRPLKVDFLPQTIQADALASILLSISGHHSGYGLPTPLIEADNVASLPEDEMENFYSRVLALTGRLSSTMNLRREQRPF